MTEHDQKSIQNEGDAKRSNQQVGNQLQRLQLTGALPLRQLHLVKAWAEDCEPVLYGEVYGVLREPAFFAQVRLDPEVRTLVWPNGADFDPYVLHEWPRAVEQLARRLRQRVVA